VLRVAILGRGPAAAAHAAAYARLAGVDVTTTVDAAVAEIGTADIVDICVPVSDRADAIRRLVGQGRAILVVPPLAASLQDADRWLKSVKRRHGRLFVTHTLRFHPVFARAKEMVSGGTMGAVRRIDLQRCWQPAAPEAANDTDGILLSQDLDFCHWLLDGGATLPEVSGLTPARAACDTAACRLTYPSAAVVDLSVRQDSGTGLGVLRQLTIECELGAVACRVTSKSWLGDTPDQVEQCEVTRAGRARRVTVPDALPLLTELGYRVGALARGEPWLCPTLVEARAALALSEAIGGRREKGSGVSAQVSEGQ